MLRIALRPETSRMRNSGDPRHVCAVLLLLLVPMTGAADDRPTVVAPGESPATANRIAEFDRRIADKNWGGALDEARAILDTAGDDLVPVDSTHSVRARRVVHARLAALPNDVLARYRDRVEGEARHWLEQGRIARDEAQLRKLVDEAFCSRPAERALELLGDLAFEAGRYADAEAWWRSLAAGNGAAAPERLAYPHPVGDLARVRAKLLMARYFQGEDSDWDRQFDEFKERHGAVEGLLGGSKGKYSDFLSKLRSESIGAARLESGWHTFGGDTGRGRLASREPRLPDRLSSLCRGGPTLRVNLPTFTAGDVLSPPERVAQRSEYSQKLAFHPLIVGGRLLIADAARVMAFDLRRLGDPGVELYPGPVAEDVPPDVRYSLTVADGCVYARLGSTAITAGTRNDKPGSGARQTRLVCLRLEPAPGEGHVRWVETGFSGGNVRKRGSVVFEGTPVVRDGLVFVAATRFESSRTITAIHCYTAEAAAGQRSVEPEPTLLWHTDICEVCDSGVVPRYRHLLLTLAGPLVVCCTHTGLVAAVDGASGRRAWVTHYKPRQLAYEERPPLTDLTPCVFAAGRLYAAPTDGRGILCLDPESGRVLWQRDGIDVVHLVGVGAGRLIFATPSGLRAVGAAMGSDGEGWAHEARTDYGKDGARAGWSPAGRPVLAGDYVLWPAIAATGEAAVHAVRQDDGSVDDNPTLLYRVPVGNLVYAEGCLASAGRDEVVVFAPPSWHLPAREQGMKAVPDSATAAIALARALTDSGQFLRAADIFARAERLAGRDSQLRQVAKDGRQANWIEAGRRALAAKDWGAARAAFARAAAAEFSPTNRVNVCTEFARALQASGRVSDEAVAWQSILDDEQLRTVRLRSGMTAGSAAAQRLATLGPSAGVGREKNAAEGLAAARSANDLERVARRYPHTEAGRAALERLARRHEADGHAGAAADCWRRLLAQCQGSRAAICLAGLAGACERQGCTDAAREYWRVLADRQSDELIPEIDAVRPTRHAVAQRLRALSTADAPALELPLRLTCEARLGPTEDLLPLPGSDLVLTVCRCTPAVVICREFAGLRERWRTSLSFRPSRAGVRDDLILIGGDDGLAALRREDGVVSWTLAPPGEYGRQRLTGFAFVGKRVLCLQDGVLLAFDAGSGEPLQLKTPAASFLPDPPPAGRFVSCFAAQGDRVRLQSAAGVSSVRSLEDGSLLGGERTGELWTSAPVLAHSRVLTVEGSRRIVCAGDCVCWTHAIPGVTTLSGKPPRIIVAGDALLVLVETNIGHQLQRLDRATGKPCWQDAVFLPETVPDPEHWAAVDGTVCFAEAGLLRALSLGDGKVVWETPLERSDRAWHVERLNNGLLAFPESPTARHFAFRSLAGQVEWSVVPDAGEAVGRGFPLVCLNMAGRVQQRFDLAAGTPSLRTSVSGGASIVPRAAVWRGVAPDLAPVQLSRRGVMVVIGPHAWCLTPSTTK
jgi:outer membrane protein assembly factor BamB/tetratricopeptide (TPR) repeat protein